MVSQGLTLTLPVRGPLAHLAGEESRALGVSEPAQLESGRAASEVGLTPTSRACVRGALGLAGPQSPQPQKAGLQTESTSGLAVSVLPADVWGTPQVQGWGPEGTAGKSREVTIRYRQGPGQNVLHISPSPTPSHTNPPPVWSW